MSFGFSIGDLAAASTLAWKIYKSCKDSSQDFQSLAADVANLHVALRETQDYCEDQELGFKQKERIVVAGHNCNLVLDAISNKLQQFESLGTSSQRTWDRLRWGMEDAAALRNQLMSTTSVLTLLNTSLANSSQARIERKLNQLVAEIKAGKRERSLLSVSTIQSLSQDDKEAYSELKRDLEDVGITMESFMEHRKFIVAWFTEVLVSGELGSGTVEEGIILARSLSTLVEAEKDPSAPMSKSLSAAHDTLLQRMSQASTSDTKRLSEPYLQDNSITALPPCEDDTSLGRDTFSKFVAQDETREPLKKRGGVFKRAFRGLSLRMSFKEGLESPLRTPLSPRSGGRSRQSATEPPLTSLPPAPPIPTKDTNVPFRLQKRNRSNTSKTMVTRWSASGGEIDLATGLSSKSRSSITEVERKITASTAPRPQSESIPDHVPTVTNKRASSARRTDSARARHSHDFFGPPLNTKFPQPSETSTTRRPSETPSEQSTKRSSRTSTALSPYERETFERHNATMKAYFERRPEQESKLDAARRSLQIGLRSNSRAPTLPINRLPDLESYVAPLPPPKDDRPVRRYTQPTRPTSMRGLETMPSASSLASGSSAHDGVESGMLTVMLPPELLAAHQASQVDGFEQKPEASEEEVMMRELTAPLKRYSINAIHEAGGTYLLKAASSGFSEAVVHLLQNGANVLIRDVQGRDALHAAVAANKPDTAMAILDSIPAHSIPELWQSTILHSAVEVGSLEMVQALLRDGANLEIQDADGRTASDVATLYGSVDILRVLQEHGTAEQQLEAYDDDDVDDDGHNDDINTGSMGILGPVQSSAQTDCLA